MRKKLILAIALLFCGAAFAAGALMARAYVDGLHRCFDYPVFR